MNRVIFIMLALWTPGVLAGHAAHGFLYKMVQDAANAQLPEGAEEIKLVDLKAPEPGLENMRVGISFKRGEDFSGTTLVQLRMAGRTRWVQAEFQLMVSTAVARKNLPRGHVLGQQDMELKSVAKKLLRGHKPILPKNAVGLLVEQKIRAGEPLVQGRLKRPLVVHRGDTVQLVVSSGGVQVSSTAKALASGRVGDVIGVSRGCGKSRGCRIRAKVVDSGLVMLELDSPDVDR